MLIFTGQMGADAPLGVVLAAIFGGIGELFRRWVKRKKNKEINSLKDAMQQFKPLLPAGLKRPASLQNLPEG